MKEIASLIETGAYARERKNHYYDRTRDQVPVRFGSFGSPLSVGFKEINCRSFESCVGILPTLLSLFEFAAPSSIPIPKFLVTPKSTVSLDLPSLPCDIDLPPFAKSAPASPTRERNPSPGVLRDSTESATQTLHRILNLEIMD
ncbi:putative F-box/kelch-repeat protein SKIP30-like isoform X1 [Capsicum annuum]|nr:putative F-box/kelch-repeat protein SKIP30-like isoform X1 [Capsicum annuum]